ncbi:MAG: SMC-Scp complex subunit ScpB [Deltaproteobacteria bacterium]|nr:SMC-Scp complex subunit ScpB [Deltaproteobacteria bacterium]
MDNHLKLIVESLLFASGEPLSPRQIRDLLPGKDLKDIKEVLKELKDEYETMKRSFLIKEVAEGFQFRSLPKFRPHIANMLMSTQSRLSKAAMETLTIIAYKQPIIRQEIERLRGVEVGGILKMLLKKGLIRIVGRKSLPGRPIIYGTTKKFLEVFDLKDISSLPTLKEIEELGDGEEE